MFIAFVTSNTADSLGKIGSETNQLVFYNTMVTLKCNSATDFTYDYYFFSSGYPQFSSNVGHSDMLPSAFASLPVKIVSVFLGGQMCRSGTSTSYCEIHHLVSSRRFNHSVFPTYAYIVTTSKVNTAYNFEGGAE